MSSHGQKRGSSGYAMASFNGHSFSTNCREKGKDRGVEKKHTTNCTFCNVLTPDQRAQHATPSYIVKKEKREAKKLETATPTKDSSSFIGVVGEQSTVQGIYFTT